MSRAIALVVVLLISACSSTPLEPTDAPEPTPVSSFSVGVHQTEEITAHVSDFSGLVTDATSVPFSRENPSGPSVRSLPDEPSIQIFWLGGICLREPTIVVEGSANALVVTLAPNVGTARSQMCPDLGVSVGLHLDLSQPVERSAIDLNVVRVAQ